MTALFSGFKNNVKANWNSWAYLLLLISGMIMFNGFWSQDFAANHIVSLPILWYTKEMSGTLWLVLSFITEFAGYLVNWIALNMINRKNNSVAVLYVPILGTYVILAMNYFMILPYSIVDYGEIWNVSLYFIILPLILIINVIKLQLLK